MAANVVFLSEETAMEHSLENGTPKVALQFCVLDEELLNDQRLLASIRDLGASYFLFCQEALHAASRKRTDKRIIFLAANFEGRNFRKTKAITSQIIGPPALLDFHASHVALAEVSLSKTIIPVLKRPLYNRVGFRDFLPNDKNGKSTTRRLNEDLLD
jgi:hypothetical protein